MVSSVSSIFSGFSTIPSQAIEAIRTFPSLCSQAVFGREAIHINDEGIRELLEKCRKENSLNPIFAKLSQSEVTVEAAEEVALPYIPTEGSPPPVVVRFFTEMVKTAIRGLSFFNDAHRPTMVWECYLLLDIYKKVLLVPISIIGLAIQCTGSISLGIAAGSCVSFLLFGAIYLYMKQNRYPHMLNHDCKKLTGTAFLPYKGRREELDRIVQATVDAKVSDEGRHIFVFGKKGTGKSRFLREGAVERLQREAPHLQVYSATEALIDGSNSTSNPIMRLKEVVKDLGVEAKNCVFILDQGVNFGDPSLVEFLNRTPATFWLANETAIPSESSLFDRFVALDFDKSTSSLDEMTEAKIDEIKMFYRVQSRGFLADLPTIRERAVKFTSILQKPEHAEMKKSWALALKLKDQCDQHPIFARALELLKKDATVDFNPNL